MKQILIIDCESQYTKLIAKNIRNLNVYCEIIHYSQFNYNPSNSNIVGLIFSGSWYSVNNPNSPNIDWNLLKNIPTLSICYSSQHLASSCCNAEIISNTNNAEFGKTEINLLTDSAIWKNIPKTINVWMSHSDIIKMDDTNVIARSHNNIPSAFECNNHIGLLFHPEVYHTEYGNKILNNFCDICNCDYSWTSTNYIDITTREIRDTVGNDNVIMAISGGVDSSVAAKLLHNAIGNQLYCVFINNGLLRLNEAENVMSSFADMNLNVSLVEQEEKFINSLNGITDPEEKRMIIGKEFINSFVEHSKKLDNIKWLGQGTIYPDIIESSSGERKIKSHHNVGGLPEHLPYKLVEPLKYLFKDEVRKIGLELGIPDNIINRHPFPGPGLSIRIISDITTQKIHILQKADDIYINTLKEECLYDKIWQAGAILLPIKTVGVMGDCRTYQYTLALRAVTSVDGMTAQVYPIPSEILFKISNRIINQVSGINRVVFDISSKPPATIEWE